MAQFTPAPINLKDVVLTIGADTYEKAVSAVTFTPNVSASKWYGMSPGATYADVVWDWDVEITFAQDHETVGNLTDLFRTLAGTKQTIQFKPKASGSRTYQANVTIVPGSLGGAGRSWAESTVTLPVDGEPTVVAPGVPVMGLASPVSGPIAGGTMVTVTGSNFTGATAVHFGTQLVPVADWTLVSPTLIVAKAPAQAAGSKPVKVTNASGQSSTSAPFSYV